MRKNSLHSEYLKLGRVRDHVSLFISFFCLSMQEKCEFGVVNAVKSESTSEEVKGEKVV